MTTELTTVSTDDLEEIAGRVLDAFEHQELVVFAQPARSLVGELSSVLRRTVLPLPPRAPLYPGSAIAKWLYGCSAVADWFGDEQQLAEIVYSVIEHVRLEAPPVEDRLERLRTDPCADDELMGLGALCILPAAQKVPKATSTEPRSTRGSRSQALPQVVEDRPEHRDLDRMRELWAQAGQRLFRGPETPSRKEASEAAAAVVIQAIVESAPSLSVAARRLDAARKTLRSLLRRLGLPAPHGHSRVRAELLADPQLGHVPDRVLAKRHGCPRETVTRARKAGAQ